MHRHLSIAYLARGAQPSWVSRLFVLGYLPLILAVSLFPFTGWRYSGEPVFDYLFYPLPHYYSVFDNFINVLAYVPLGFSLVMGWRLRWWAWLPALVLGLVLSACVEFVQQFLPGRVSSNLDVLANGAGALLGGLLAYLSARWQVNRRWLLWRQQILLGGAWGDFGITLAVLWLITQMDPSVPLLGLVVEPRGLPQPFVSPLADPLWFLRLIEGGGMALNLAGVGLFVMVLQAHRRHLGLALAIWLLSAILLKMLTAGMLLKPTQFFAWLNWNVVVGGCVGGVLLLLASQLQRRWQALLGALALLLAQAIASLWPLTPVWSATIKLFRWHYGHLLHLSGLIEIVSEWWPYACVLFLLGVLVQAWTGQRRRPTLG